MSFYDTEPDNRDDASGPLGDCSWCGARSGQPCEPGCLPGGAEAAEELPADLVLVGVRMDEGGR